MNTPTQTQLTLINSERATMADVARLAQQRGVIVVERGGEFAFCNTRIAPRGWHRVGIHDKAAA